MSYFGETYLNFMCHIQCSYFSVSIVDLKRVSVTREMTYIYLLGIKTIVKVIRKMNITAEADRTNKYLQTAATVLSVFGSSIIILTFFVFKDIRTPARHIIVCIAISDLVSSLSNCLGLFRTQDTSEGKDPLCILQSFVSSTFILSSFLWTMLLAVFLYIVIVCEKSDSEKKIIFPLFHGISWILPLIINIAAITNEKLGDSRIFVTAGWCWIDLGKYDRIKEFARTPAGNFMFKVNSRNTRTKCEKQ